MRREKTAFKPTFLSGLLVPLSLIIIVFSGCTRPEEKSSSGSLEDQADRIMHNAAMEFTEEGLLTAKLQSEKLLFFDDQHIIWGFNINVDFFDKMGKPAGVLTADSGWVKNETRQITVYGRVKINMDDGTRLWADSLSYYPDINRIRTESDVQIERRGEFISGNSLDSDMNFEDIKISGNVSGRLRTQ